MCSNFISRNIPLYERCVRLVFYYTVEIFFANVYEGHQHGYVN